MKKLGFILLVIVLLLIINGLIASIFDLWQKQDLLATARAELNFQKQKNAKLKADLSYDKTQAFLDETARNDLFLVKPGEQDVIIQNDSAGEAKNNQNVEMSNWQKWLKLFF